MKSIKTLILWSILSASFSANAQVFCKDIMRTINFLEANTEMVAHRGSVASLKDRLTEEKERIEASFPRRDRGIARTSDIMGQKTYLKYLREQAEERLEVVNKKLDLIETVMTRKAAVTELKNTDEKFSREIAKLEKEISSLNEASIKAFNHSQKTMDREEYEDLDVQIYKKKEKVQEIRTKQRFIHWLLKAGQG